MKTVERDIKGIRHWMIDNDLSVITIAQEVGVAHSVVSNTFAGRRNDRKVLRYAVDRGCPVECLNLPKDMKEAA